MAICICLAIIAILWPLNVYTSLSTGTPSPGKTGKEHDCGAPAEELLSRCIKPDSFPKCKSFAVPVKIHDIETKLILNKKHQSTYRQSLSLQVKWKIPKAGNSDIWGWQIMLLDLHLSPGVYSCVQVNKLYLWESTDGERYVNFTFHEILFGTRLMVSVQSLPAMDMTLVNKTVRINDFCHFHPGSPCCYKIKEVVVDQRSQTSVMITWPGYKNETTSKMLIGYDVYYKSFPNRSCHYGHFRLQFTDHLNSSNLTIQDLKSSCQNYTVKIRPVFNSSICDMCITCDKFSKGGRLSKPFIFQLNQLIVQPSTPKLTKHPRSKLLKVLIVVMVVSVLVIGILIFLMIRHRKSALTKTAELIETKAEKPATEIFIAHSSHCVECENVALAVATYLNMTGHCKCFLDLCSLPKEWFPGKTQYYENEIRKREKVIIMCTVNDDQESQENPGARNFIYQKNLVRSEILVNCTTTKFIPIYMDFSSDLDIPCFLRNAKSFSLPSQLMELVLYIIDQPLCKPVSVHPMLSLEEDSNLLKQKKILETKIRDLKIKHQKKFRNKNNNLVAKVV